MTDQNPSEMDPAATFRLDQEAARTEQEDRDAWAWDFHVRNHNSIVAQQEAQARWIGAKASLLSTLDTVVWLAIILAGLYVISHGALVIVEAVR